MAGETYTSNMSLIVPAIGLTAGPDYASDINSDLSIIDAHNHASGSGVQINPSGLNINADLPFNNNNLTLVKTVGFQAQTSNSSTAALYSIGVDLYFNDGNGNVIRITQGGSVAGSAGTITGLPSGTASASYALGVFTFQASTNTGANLDVASIVLRNGTASSNGLTLSPPNALSSNYQLFLPIIPAQTNVMTLDSSGNMGSATWDFVGQSMTSTGANAIGASMNSTGANAVGVSMTSTGANAVAASRTRSTGSTVGTGGVAISSGCGFFTTASASPVDVTNLAVTITTSGRPVFVGLINDVSNIGSFGASAGSAGSSSVACYIVRGSTTISQYSMSLNLSASTSYSMTVPSAGINQIDTPSAGTYTYKVQLSGGASITAALAYAKLVAYEL